MNDDVLNASTNPTATAAVLDPANTAPAPAPNPDAEPPPRRRGGTPPGRIVGLDWARGLAVLGMFAAHLVMTAEFSWTDPGTWGAIVDGRSAILFATLAGLSIGLMTAGRPRRSLPLLQARMKIVTRAILILVIGVVLEALGTNIAVILGAYALLFLMMLPFVTWSVRRLVALTAGSAVIGAAVYFVLVPWLGIGTGTTESGVSTTLIGGMYPVVIWFTFFSAGLTVSRLNLRSLRTQAALVVTGIALVAVGHFGYVLAGDAATGTVADAGSFAEGSAEIDAAGSGDAGSGDADGAFGGSVLTPAEIPDGVLCEQDPINSFFFCYDPATMADTELNPSRLTADSLREALLTENPHSGSPFEVVGSGGFALVVIGLCLLGSRLRFLRGLLWPLGAVGSMALTAYAAHLVVISFGVELGADSWTTWTLFAAGALALCSLWKAFVGRGPLERLLAAVARRATTIDATAIDATAIDRAGA